MKSMRSSFLSFLSIAFLFVLSFLTPSCGGRTYDDKASVTKEEQDYTVLQNPNGGQVVVVKDNSGSEFLMEYMLYQQLLRSGGQEAVVNHYHTNKTTYVNYSPKEYKSWKSSGTVSRVSNTMESSPDANKPVFKQVKPAASSSTMESSKDAPKPAFRKLDRSDITPAAPAKSYTASFTQKTEYKPVSTTKSVSSFSSSSGSGGSSGKPSFVRVK